MFGETCSTQAHHPTPSPPPPSSPLPTPNLIILRLLPQLLKISGKRSCNHSSPSNVKTFIDVLRRRRRKKVSVELQSFVKIGARIRNTLKHQWKSAENLLIHKYQNLEVSSFQLLVLAKDSRFNLKNRSLISFPYDKFFRRNTATLCCEFRTDRERSRRKKKTANFHPHYRRL